jgi:sugar/nucleoside kinase (ribokinase family)
MQKSGSDPGPAFDVVGLGENSVDVVYRVPGAPAPNAKLSVSSSRVFCGGQVATTLATCAAFGLRTAYVGTFGSDDNGSRIREALAARGVDTTHATVCDAPNRHAVIIVDERTGDRTVVWHRDTRLALGAGDVPRTILTGARLLHVDDLDEDASIEAARTARAAGLLVTSDIDRATGRTADLAASVSVPIFSWHVLSSLTGESDPEQALRKQGARHKGWLSVTLGTDGAMLLDGDRLHHVPACEVDAVDTTGAGDIFRGAFIYALLRGQGPADVLRFAVAAAGLGCTKEGAIDSVPAREDVERLLVTKD